MELWKKCGDAVCRPYQHRFIPTKLSVRDTDKCSKCMTIRLPSNMKCPIESTNPLENTSYPQHKVPKVVGKI
jgi:hypothetical protein